MLRMLRYCVTVLLRSCPVAMLAMLHIVAVVYACNEFVQSHAMTVMCTSVFAFRVRLSRTVRSRPRIRTLRHTVRCAERPYVHTRQARFPRDELHRRRSCLPCSARQRSRVASRCSPASKCMRQPPPCRQAVIMRRLLSLQWRVREASLLPLLLPTVPSTHSLQMRVASDLQAS